VSSGPNFGEDDSTLRTVPSSVSVSHCAGMSRRISP
jgi:hypothetical protein